MTEHGTDVTVVAVDLGASSGRVMLGRCGPQRLDLQQAHRFSNDVVVADGRFFWDIDRLYDEVLAGLRAAVLALEPHESMPMLAIDSWAIDYGLLGADGQLLARPHAYRDQRSQRGVAAVHAVITPEELYERHGLQWLPFTTLYQLATEDPAMLRAATAMLLIPDLLVHRLTGAIGAEITNASTTGLLSVATGEWDLDLAARLGFPATLFPPLRAPGERLGTVLPATSANIVYISSGTWSLVGMELDRAVVSDAGRIANVTNERGVDDTFRMLRNVTGLWILTESLRTWSTAGAPDGLESLLADAASLPAGGPVFDADDPVFLPPGDMPTRIAHVLTAVGARPPTTRAGMVRCVLDSLAAAYARAARAVQDVAGVRAAAVHVVGGGSQNALLAQLTADRTGLPVLAGPVEATALGNVLVQARAANAVPGDRFALRALVQRTSTITRYEPSDSG